MEANHLSKLIPLTLVFLIDMISYNFVHATTEQPLKSEMICTDHQGNVQRFRGSENAFDYYSDSSHAIIQVKDYKIYYPQHMCIFKRVSK